MQALQGGQTSFGDDDYDDTIGAYARNAKSIQALAKERVAKYTKQRKSPISGTKVRVRGKVKRVGCAANVAAHDLGHGSAMRTSSGSCRLSPPQATFIVYPFARHYSCEVFGSTKQLFERERCDK